MWLRIFVRLLLFSLGVATQDLGYMDNGTHWIVLPTKITPGKPLFLTFNFYNTTEDIDVQVDLLQYDHKSLVSEKHTFPQAQARFVQLQVPKVLHHKGSFKLLITGLRGVFFQQRATLTYDAGVVPKRFAVHTQLDKAIYKPGQTIHFRTFGVYSDMSVFTGRFDVIIKDPNQNIMFQLQNVTSGAYGVVEDFMIMDEEPVLGNWEITSTAHKHFMDNNNYPATTRKKTFKIDKYVLPKFSVSVELPSYVVTTDTEMTGTISSKYTFGGNVIGTARITADIAGYDLPWHKHDRNSVMVETTIDVNGDTKFTIPFDQITHELDPSTYEPLVTKLAGHTLTIKASVTDGLTNTTRNASATVRLYKEPYKIAFDRGSSPMFFKPGLPYVGHITVTQADGRPVISSNKDILLRSSVKFLDNEIHSYRAHTMPNQTFAPPANGHLEFVVDPPNNTYSLHLTVEFKGLRDSYDLSKPSWLREEGNLMLTQTNSSQIGLWTDFELRSADPMQSVFYSIVTNGHVIKTGMIQTGGNRIEHISFEVTHDMKPYSKLIVYYFTTNGWNADSVNFMAESASNLFKNKVAISFDRNQAEPAENVSLQINTDPQSLVSVLAVDQSVRLLATGNDVTQSSVISSISPDNHPSSDARQLHDPRSIMNTPGIQTLTDVVTFSWTQHSYRRQSSCGGTSTLHTTPSPGYTVNPTSGGCVDKLTTCSLLDPNYYCVGDYYSWGLENCKQFCGYCAVPASTTAGNLQEVTHVRDEFPETWLWTNVTSGQDGTAIISSTVPDTITSWYATAFSINQNTGLGITDGPAKFTTFRPFFINLNLPYSAVRGEELVLQIDIFNYLGTDLDVVLTLNKSDDFDIIQNKSGHVSYLSKEIVKNVHIKAGVPKAVFIPVRPHVIGTADIAVKAQSSMSADAVVRQLKIEAEGNPMHFNVPLMLGQGNPTDVPLSFPDNIVLDSQKVQVSVIGDVMGPTMNNVERLLRLPTGCGEQTMMSLAPDVFVYNYLNATNQLTPEIAERTKRYMVTGYQRELGFQRNDGSFSIWGARDREGSMWLTAFVLKSFHQAKDHIFISDNVLLRAADWIRMYQSYDGHFPQKGAVHSTSLKGRGNSNYSLTAFVLIALLENEGTLSKYNNHVSNSAVRARSYLESNLVHMTNVYDLAVTAYALAKSGSIVSFKAYEKLGALMSFKDGMKYWSVPDELHVDKPWNLYTGEPPLSIEVTAYVLLYLVETKQLNTGLPIYKWLVTQRNCLGGFRSTQDTVLGLQALSEFGKTYADGIDLTVNIDAHGFHRRVQVTKNEAMVLKLVDLPASAIPTPVMHGAAVHSTSTPPVPPVVSLEANGTGFALTQVSISFNVEAEPSIPAFNLTAEIQTETLHSIVIKVCARYEPAFFLGNGRMCVLEVDMPTGFSADLESKFSDISGSKKSEIRNKKTVVLYYDEITTSATCAYIEMVREDLVANLKPSAVRVYDYYQPERYRALHFYQSTLLRDSSYCDVCRNCGC